MTKKILFGALVLATASVLGSCSSEDLLMGSPNQKWKATGTVTIDGEDDLTRALSVGGNNGKVLYFNWAGGETLLVRNAAGADAGTMTATVRPGNTAIADIDGEITGTYSVGDKVTYLYPSVAMDFTGQKGTIASLSSSYQFLTSEVEVKEVDSDNKVVTMGGATLHYRMAVLRLRLTDAAGNRLNVEELKIKAASGKLVKAVAEDGTKTYFADGEELTVTPDKEDGAYPNEFLIALLNDSGAKDTYTLTAKVGSSYYTSVTDAQKISAKFVADKFYTGVRALTKTVDGDVETTGDFTFSAIEPQTYTGSPLTPAITVSYNGTTLTSGTDYDLHYFDNTNVGRAFVVAVGKGETYGDKAGVTTFTINSKSLEASMVYAIPDQTYTGSAIEPTVVVKDGGKTLTAGTDYTVTYADNVNVGTATVTITATGNYSGELEKTFNIVKATPVITMSTDEMKLKPEETATRTATTTFGTVSYSSSDTSVATVDATTGKVTAVADGTATITASVAESDNWNSASKQYTVTVKTSTGPDTGDLGKVLGSDGNVYDKVSDVPSGVTASGIIAYVGEVGSADSSSSDYTCLVLALTDANRGSTCQWYTVTSGTCVSQSSAIATAITYKNGIECTNTLVNSNGSGVTTNCSGHTHAAASAARSYSTVRPDGASAWFLPSIGQWNLIVQGLATKKAGSAVTTNLTTSSNSAYNASNLNTVITAAGGTGVQSLYYWSSTECNADRAWAMYFRYGRAYNYRKSDNGYVRAVFAY